MNDITLLTYTNTKVEDLHEAYFSRIKKFFPDLEKKITLCNQQLTYTPTVVYSDEQHTYPQQICNALNNIDTEYVLYSQEDYLLYDYVDTRELQRILDYMNANKRIGFVRLIQNSILNTQPVNEFLVEMSSDILFYFSTQATIWRKDIFRELFLTTNTKLLRDEAENSSFLKALKTRGCCTTFSGERVNDYHYKSIIYPYICTGLVNGAWNCSEYSTELEAVFKEYNIDRTIRGTR